MTSAAMLSEADVATQAATLRAELKEWEKAFAAANGGRKAGREDIKKDPTIAAKYKAYSRLRSHDQSSTDKGKDTPTKRTVPLKLEHQESKKRKHGSPTGPGNHPSTSTPRKAARGDFSTPMKGRVSNIHPSHLDPYDSPSTLRRLFSPSTHKQGEPSPLPLKTAIGPTPQRDGKALGLFDLLSASGGSTATPSAQRLATVSGEAMQTPSRKRNLDTIKEEDEEEEETGRIERTPASSSKKLYLENLFATPTTLRYAAMVEDENDGKPPNRAVPDPSTKAAEEPDESETPSFLRRIHSGVFTDSSGLSPIAVRKPQQRFVGKGLSALVKGLRVMARDMEAEKAQDDWDVLREMEAEQAANNDVQVADSQAAPGTGEEATRRPWKKKGQKRTTRRVVMRPVVAKSKPGSRGKSSENRDQNDESEDELKAVSETQPTDAAKEDEEGEEQEGEEAEEADLHTASEPELDDSDSEYEDSGTVKKSSSFSEKIKAALSGKSKSNTKGEKPEAEQGTAKKPAARKINPQAHANYRSLKIRNKGSKGKGAGRWGRRR
ncbi:hypothetical protein VTN02DRAFT_4023 [Thermoascus thermophilus]